jgi:hypothetical protein
MSEELQITVPKPLNLFQWMWKKIPDTWPQFFWSLLWAFLLVHPIAIIYYFVNDISNVW